MRTANAPQRILIPSSGRGFVNCIIETTYVANT